MLQQTTVATVGPYFQRFIERWPNVAALARAPLDDALHAWQGLGYYARARNLHRCAREIVECLGGVFPENEAALRELPGIGQYTAAAIAAIAFDLAATPVDGNAERVVSRVFAVDTAMPAAKSRLRSLAATLTPRRRAGDYAQAVMDLGATLCSPRQPRCPLCPWVETCAAAATGNPEAFPVRRPKGTRPIRHGIAFWVERSDGKVLLRRRPESGLLGGMMEVPSTPWRAETWAKEEAVGEAPLKSRWRELPGIVRHVFTHFELRLTVLCGRAAASRPAKGIWCRPDHLYAYALPTLMKKVAAHARAAL